MLKTAARFLISLNWPPPNPPSAEERIESVATRIVTSLDESQRREFASMIDGMIAAGEQALAVYALRTQLGELEEERVDVVGSVETDLRHLEREFADDIARLIVRD